MTAGLKDFSGFYTRSCEVFIVCARLKSFSAAAEVLQTSQSSISQTIKRLENSLHFNLFERETRPLRTTQEGEALYKKLSLDSEQNRRMVELFRTRNYLKPVLDIGLIESAASFCGAELTQALDGSVGQLRLSVETSDKLLMSLMERELDMAVVSVPEVLSPSLQWNLLFLEPWVVLFPEGYPIPSHDPLSWEELQLCGLPFIHHGKYTANSRCFNAIKGFERRALANKFELDSNFMIYEFVSQGIGWSITQPQGISLFRSSSNIQVRRAPAELEKRKVFLVARRNCSEDLQAKVCRTIKGIIRKKVEDTLGQSIPWLLKEFQFVPD